MGKQAGRRTQVTRAARRALRTAVIVLAAGVIGTGAATAGRPAAAASLPAGQDVVRRMLTTVSHVRGFVSADVEFRLRVSKPLSEPPDCVFRGTAWVKNGLPIVRIADRSAGLLCWAVNRYVIGRPFQGSERLDAFLSRFDYDVIAEKLVDGDRHYLVRARAKDPRNEPKAMIGWIDFDQGLLMENTVEYSWGTVDATQKYERTPRTWLLTHQYVYTPRFHASMEIVYSNFVFGPV